MLENVVEIVLEKLARYIDIVSISGLVRIVRISESIYWNISWKNSSGALYVIIRAVNANANIFLKIC